MDKSCEVVNKSCEEKTCQQYLLTNFLTKVIARKCHRKLLTKVAQKLLKKKYSQKFLTNNKKVMKSFEQQLF